MTTLTATTYQPLIDFRALLRITLALSGAVMVTVALFYAMHLMIFNDQVAPPEVTEDPVIVFDIDVTPIVEHIEEKPERPKPIEAEPEMPEIEFVPNTGDQLNLSAVAAPPVTNTGIGTIGLGSGQLSPFIRVSPRYPRRALERGIEGFVDVSFDVTSYGGTDNVTIIGAEPAGTFDRSALKAVRKWKYKPELIDGQPQPAFGLRERIRFRLEN